MWDTLLDEFGHLLTPLAPFSALKSFLAESIIMADILQINHRQIVYMIIVTPVLACEMVDHVAIYRTAAAVSSVAVTVIAYSLALAK